MKWLAVVLIVTNLAAYLLVGDRQDPLHTARSDFRSDVNRTGMLLLAEVEASQLDSAVPGSRTEATETIAGAAPEPIPLKKPIDGSGDQGVDQWVTEACYRLGPFRREASWQAAKRWMEESGLAFSPVTSGARQLLAFRVYLGPFASESSVDATLKRLESSGLEYFRYQTDNGLTRISMGLFSQEELAKKYLEYLIGNRYQAKFQPEYRRLGPLNWMEISSAEVDQERLSGHGWDESGVAMTRVNCQA